jgi:hypothetical protein
MQRDFLSYNSLETRITGREQMRKVNYNVTQVRFPFSVLQVLELPCHSVLSGTICSPVPSASLVFHISYLGTMLYFDHCTCKVCQQALHIVHIANLLQVLKQANKILLQCTVHTPNSFKLHLEVSQTIQRRNNLVLGKWTQIK